MIRITALRPRAPAGGGASGEPRRGAPRSGLSPGPVRAFPGARPAAPPDAGRRGAAGADGPRTQGVRILGLRPRLGGCPAAQAGSAGGARPLGSPGGTPPAPFGPGEPSATDDSAARRYAPRLPTRARTAQGVVPGAPRRQAEDAREPHLIRTVRTTAARSSVPGMSEVPGRPGAGCAGERWRPSPAAGRPWWPRRAAFPARPPWLPGAG